jgi:hypothetical protein
VRSNKFYQESERRGERMRLKDIPLVVPPERKKEFERSRVSRMNASVGGRQTYPIAQDSDDDSTYI